MNTISTNKSFIKNGFFIKFRNYFRELIKKRTSLLYFKLFLSFIAILLVTEALIFLIFVPLIRNEFSRKVNRLAHIHANVVESFLNETTQANTPPFEMNQKFKKEKLVKFLSTLADTYHADTWMEDKNANMIASSDDKFLIQLSKLKLHKRKSLGPHSDNFTVYREKYESDDDDIDEMKMIHTVINIHHGEFAGGKIHILHQHHHEDDDFEYLIIMGLSGIGILIALLIIPVTKHITKPIHSIIDSTQKFASGDLSHRANVKRYDELGDLAANFNNMAVRIEAAICDMKELTANISHELRSPLARIRIIDELLQNSVADVFKDHVKQESSETSLRYLQTLRAEVEELDRLIGKILDLSRADMGYIGKKTSVSPEKILKEVLDKMETLFVHKSVLLNVSLTEKNIFLEADGDAIYSAIHAVIENAAKFAPEDSDVFIDASLTDPNGNIFSSSNEDSKYQGKDYFYILKVKNKSDAISAVEHKKIFKPFYRAVKSNETTQIVLGTHGFGLGLAITHKIIERYHGEVLSQTSNGYFEIQIRLPVTLA